jgi:hypothetical protein
VWLVCLLDDGRGSFWYLIGWFVMMIVVWNKLG